MASVLEQYFGLELSAFPTQRPALNVILLSTTLLCVLFILQQFLKGLVFWVKQEHAYWGVPSDPVASFLYGHTPFVSLQANKRVHVCQRAQVGGLGGRT